MKIKGRLSGIAKDYITGESLVRFSTSDRVESMADLGDRELSIEVKRWRNRRSLSANAYFYVLVGKIADAIHRSQNYVHNCMLRQYGQPFVMDGEIVYTLLPDTDEASARADELETVHLKPTSIIKPGKEGHENFRAYIILRGSHEYDSKEMSTLIDGVVSEAQELGIQTATPDELARIKATVKGRIN